MQFPGTCAGEATTYTTDESAPLGILYPFCPRLARDFPITIGKSPAFQEHRVGTSGPAWCFVFQSIKGGKNLTTDELVEFTHVLAGNYNKILKSDVYTMYKLKEIWMYAMLNYPDEKKILKSIKKSTRLSDFMKCLEALPEIKNDLLIK